jgi:hypothetical protein
MFAFTSEKIKCRKLNQIETKISARMKVKCVMWNEQIDGLTINHSLDPLPKQKRMQALDAKEMESFSKINLKNAS